ncbi:hypothetical protein QBC32DRAFT_377870 [Pseudoneurospora amorphoporcata]|uniref:Uncharacterized protein n=1 Tax=Pseudoneurospora amorphoporcata TaxID=241081 RepID=A0AAN6NRN3_9PEZI|nr:hypothetical protein QBC32DRAFT_377870 [Pseudoneurospora amorphoporcata]
MGRICDKEDVDNRNPTNGDWDEGELDKNMNQHRAAILNSLDDPFVDAPSPPPPRNKTGKSVTESATEAKAHKDTGIDNRKERNSSPEETFTRLTIIEEKLADLRNSSRRMTRAQSRKLARLSDEYSRLCAEFHHIPQDLSPLGSSELLKSHSDYSNNTNSRSSTSSGPIGPAIRLRTQQDFEEYHEYQKIKFVRLKTEDYQMWEKYWLKVDRRGRGERLLIALGSKKRRLKKYWDWLAQRSGEMDRELNNPWGYTRVPSRSPSDNFTGFYERWRCR